MTITPKYIGDRAEWFNALNDLRDMAGRNSQEHGFWDRGGKIAQDILDDVPYAEDAEREYLSTRLMLIVGEVAEAHEEIRKGLAVNHEYVSYPPSLVAEIGPEAAAERFAREGLIPKPEGVPSELADILIRVLDFCAEQKIDIGSVVRHKMEFNATRPRLHGKKL
jgi:NTP pyrophosphatase (non-canonical NTP hydrolase)